MALDRTGDYTYDILDELSDKELAAEYRYRLRKRSAKGISREEQIRRILSYVDKTGNGPEELKTMLGNMFRL